MDYQVKYSGTFYDFQQRECKVEIWEDGYSGALLDLKFGATPVLLKLDSQNEDIFAPIKMTSIELQLEKTDEDEYNDIVYNSDSLRQLMVFYISGTIKFIGKASTNGFSEPFRSLPYTITVQAVDGISILNDTTIAAPSTIYSQGFYGDTYYRAWRISFEQILTQLFTALPDGITIRNYSNIKHYTGTELLSVLDLTTYFSWDLLEGKSLYDVLELIMGGFGLQVRFEGDTINIYSLYEVLEWVNGESTPFVEYSYNSVAGITSTPGSGIVQPLTIGNQLMLEPGGSIQRNPQYGKIKVTTDLGSRDNIFLGADLSNAVTIDDNSNATVYFWKRADTKVISNIISYGDNLAITSGVVDNQFGYLVEKGAYLLFHFKFKDASDNVFQQSIESHRTSIISVSFDYKLNYESSNNYPLLAYLINNEPLYLFNQQANLLRFVDRIGNYWQFLLDQDQTALSLRIHGIENVDRNWKTAQFPIYGIDQAGNIASPFYDHDMYFLLAGAYNGSIMLPVAYRNFKVSLNYLDENNNLIPYPEQDLLDVVIDSNNPSVKEIKPVLASSDIQAGTLQLYNTMHQYMSTVIIEKAAGEFYQLGNVRYGDNGEDMKLQDYVGRYVAGIFTVQQKNIKCQLNGGIDSLVAPIFNLNAVNDLYVIGSCSYDFKRMRGDYEMIQYVQYQGFDPGYILSEDGAIMQTEDGAFDMILEKNI